VTAPLLADTFEKLRERSKSVDEPASLPAAVLDSHPGA
jgi:hypothetical protein